MKCITTFDPKKDMGKVIDGLFPDINELIENHKISDTASSEVYNQISELKDVGIRINDDFDAIMYARALKNSLAPNQGTGSSQPSGTSAPQATSAQAPSAQAPSASK